MLLTFIFLGVSILLDSNLIFCASQCYNFNALSRDLDLINSFNLGGNIMLTTFKATAKKLPEGMQVETASRGFKMLMDEPAELGGTDKAMNPVEAVLCALGACQSIVVAAFAQAHDFTYEEFHVELEGDLDPDGFMGLSDARKGFQEIRFTMHFKTNESQEKTEKFVEFVEATCPVGDCLANGVKLVNSGVVRD